MYGDAGKIPPAAGAGGLAYTGFDTFGWTAVALVLLVVGFLLVRMSYLRKARHRPLHR